MAGAIYLYFLCDNRRRVDRDSEGTKSVSKVMSQLVVVNMHALMYVYLYVCTYTCMCIYVCIYVVMFTYTVFVCMYVYISSM